MQALSVAGPYGAYLYFALSASPDVLDAKPYGPEHYNLLGEVHVYVLSRTGEGTADQALLDTVLRALNDEDVRPLATEPPIPHHKSQASSSDHLWYLLWQRSGCQLKESEVFH
ncbi:hypothetical protein D8682_05650 [Buttiauxella sp. 3AFRM03]|nr:hypothetical protein D8682_05650 [Buttiauxella sp. 3AFRM03]